MSSRTGRALTALRVHLRLTGFPSDGDVVEAFQLADRICVVTLALRLSDRVDAPVRFVWDDVRGAVCAQWWFGRACNDL